MKPFNKKVSGVFCIMLAMMKLFIICLYMCFIFMQCIDANRTMSIEVEHPYTEMGLPHDELERGKYNINSTFDRPTEKR